MRLLIRHSTVYTYDAPIEYAVQSLRLTPRPHEGQRINHWRVAGDDDASLPSYVDGLGNVVHLHALNRVHTRAEITVTGEVETTDMAGVVRGAAEPLPPGFFLRETRLTEADGALRDLAGDAAGEDQLSRLHDLSQRIRQKVLYSQGRTETTTPAAEALERGAGVCQDHAHVFIACARALAIPARYVGGYLWTGAQTESYEAGHAWAEAHVEGLGWVGFDCANGVSPTDAYVRTAVGLDYWSAAPVRGQRRGSAEERMTVEVDVEQAAAQQ